jgi:hypothetical protein
MNSKTSNVIGYSSTDFFYENPNYCAKTSGIQKYSTQTDDATCNNIIQLTDPTYIDQCSCNANQLYGEQLQLTKRSTDTDIARYDNTVKTYNHELLRTINYLAGIGMLAAYIYVNQMLKP